MPEGKPTLKCPTCGKASEFNCPPPGLFCSERCKAIDLGRWLGEEYLVSEPLDPGHLAEFEESAPGNAPGLNWNEPPD